MQQRAAAIDALASEIYDSQVSRSSPAWETLDPDQKFHWLDIANKTINKVLALVTPADPDVEVLRFRLCVIADELEQVPLLTGPRVAEMLRYAATFQPLSDEDPTNPEETQ